jgi:hypothetical protein
LDQRRRIERQAEPREDLADYVGVGDEGQELPLAEAPRAFEVGSGKAAGEISERLYNKLVEGLARALDAKHAERAHGHAEQLLGDVGALAHVEHDAAGILKGIDESGLLQLLENALRD